MLAIGPWPTTLILRYTPLFFSLLLQHKDFTHLLPLFAVVVFSYEKSPFLHKNVMFHTWNSTLNASIVAIELRTSKYLSLCVSGGFSQNQSHIILDLFNGLPAVVVLIGRLMHRVMDVVPHASDTSYTH